MALLFALVFLLACWLVWRTIAYFLGAWVAFTSLAIVLILFLDFFIPRGPFWFDTEELFFDLASYDHIGLSIMSFILGPAAALGGIVGLFQGLRRREFDATLTVETGEADDRKK